MKIFIRVLLFMLISIGCSTVYANNFISTQDLAYSSFLIGLDGGYTWMGTPTSRMERVEKGQGSDLLSHSQGYFSWGAFGGYQVVVAPQTMLGIQLGYHDYGKSTITYSSTNKYKFTQYGVEVVGTGEYIWRYGFGVVAHAGLTYVREQYKNVEHNSTTTSPDPTSNESAYFPLVRAGFSYHLNKHFGIYALYGHIFGETQKTITDAFGPKYVDPIYKDSLTSVARSDSVFLRLQYNV